MKTDATGWKPGLPPGPATPETVAKFEVYFSPAGLKWHRPRAAIAKATGA